MTRQDISVRMAVQWAALCFMSALLAGCMATAAVTVASQTVKTTAKVAGTAARITMDGAQAASHTITRPFRKDEDKNNL